MFVFFEYAPPPNQHPQPHPNEHLVPTVTPNGPSPVIKVPRLPGVGPAPMIRAVPQQQPMPQQAPSTSSNLAKNVGMFGAGIATAALAHHFLGNGGDHHEQDANDRPPVQKAVYQAPQAPAPAPKAAPPPQPVTNTVREIHHYHHDRPTTYIMHPQTNLSPTSSSLRYAYPALGVGTPARIGNTPFDNVHPTRNRLDHPYYGWW